MGSISIGHGAPGGDLRGPSVTVSWDHGEDTTSGPRYGRLTARPVIRFHDLLDVFRSSALAMGFSASLVDEVFRPDEIYNPDPFGVAPKPGPSETPVDSEGGHAD